MKQYLFSKTAGWITLGALLALAPQITGCDTSSKRPPVNERAEVKKASLAEPKASAKTPETISDKPKPASEKEAPAAAPTDTTKELNKAASDSPLVRRLVIASSVDKREPVEISESKIKEPVVAFVELKHDSPYESGVVITFVHEDGKKVGFVQLNVPGESPRYRTWARTQNIDMPGTWTAIVASEEGEELARKSFTVSG